MIPIGTAKHYFAFLNVVFITVAAYLGVSGVYKVAVARLDYVKPTPVRAEEADSPVKTASLPLSHYREITERNLFNTRDEIQKPPPKPEKEDLASLKPTELKLKLYGTVTGSESRSYAVIQDLKKRRQQLYSEGDRVQTATVKQILRNKVVLSVNGQNEVLEIQKRQAGPARSNPFNRSVASTSKAPVTRKIAVSRNQVDQAMSNVNSLMRQARVRPHFTNGKPDGLTLTRIRRNSIFRRLGLRNGDIITGVGGEPIESVDDALKFYNNLKSASDVSLEIKRRGRVRKMEYSIR